MNTSTTLTILSAAVLALACASESSAQYRMYDFEGYLGQDDFGFSVDGIGDINLDGYDDMIVGAANDDDFGIDSGSARVFSGKDGSVLFDVEGDDANDWFGFELLSAPSNATYAILALSDPCVEPGTPWIACDTVKIPLTSPQIVPIPFVAGASPCGTAVSAPVAIPVLPSLLGLGVGFQWALSCDAAILGTSISNCVSFVVTN